MLRKRNESPRKNSKQSDDDGGETPKQTCAGFMARWNEFRPQKSRGFILTCIIAFVGIQSIVVQHFYFLRKVENTTKKVELSAKSNKPAHCERFELGPGMDIPGGDLGQGMTVQDVSFCCQACTNHEKCSAFSYVHETSGCWLKEVVSAIGKKVNITSGIKMMSTTQKNGSFNAAFKAVQKNGGKAVPLKKPTTPSCCTSNKKRFGAPGTTGDDGKPIIWFDAPPKDFAESFAIGNGRLGSLVFFDHAEDKLLLTEDTVWAGAPKQHPKCPDNLDPKLRDVKPVAMNLTWDGPHQKKFLSGQSSASLFADVDQAKKLCEKEAHVCSGVTWDPGSKKWMLRVGTDLQASPANEVSWLLKGSVKKDGAEFLAFRTAREKALAGDLAGASTALDAFPRGQSVSGFEYLAKLSLTTLGGKPKLKRYARRLALDSGVAEVTFTAVAMPPTEAAAAHKSNASRVPPAPSLSEEEERSVTFEHKREAFASVGGDVVWLRMECSPVHWGLFQQRRSCINVTAALQREGGADKVEVRQELALGPQGAQTKFGLLLLSPRNLMAANYQGVGYVACAGVVVDGGASWPSIVGNTLQVGADSKVDIVVAGATRYNKETKQLEEDKGAARARCEQTLKAAIVKGHEAVKKAHVAEHSALFTRSELRIWNKHQEDAESCPSQLTTKERVLRYMRACHGEAKNVSEVVDVGLQQLMFDFGKYMLMGASRPGSQPMNLVGIWGEGVRTPWSGDYHLNINFQMMYWAAEVVNMHETTDPLRSFMKALARSGESAAQCSYGSKGWVAHGFTDAWMSGRTLGDTAWSMCVVCGAWAAMHLWDMYRHTRDAQLLRDDVLPVLGGAVEFFLDYLVAKGPGGSLISGPSHSPENAFRTGEGNKFGHIAMGPSLDTGVVYDVMTSFVDGCEESGCAGGAGAGCAKTRCELAGRANRTRVGLPNRGFPEVDGEGYLEEWLRGMPGMEKHAAADHGHRHFSPLYALHPGDQIQAAGTPGLAMAARNFLERKMAAGGGHTGWSAAWAGALYARLGDGEGVQRMVDRILGRFALPNLFTTHPPLDNSVKGCAVCMKEGKLPEDEHFWGMRGASGKSNFELADQTKFQLDANLGLLAAMAEGLVQSRDRECGCLPMKHNISYQAPSGVHPPSGQANAGGGRRKSKKSARKAARRLTSHTAGEEEEGRSAMARAESRRAGSQGVADGRAGALIGRQKAARALLERHSEVGRGLKASLLTSLGNLTGSLFNGQRAEQPVCSCGSREGATCEVELLPALPSQWTEGQARGLRTRCGVEVAMRWEGGELQGAEVTWVWQHVPPRHVRLRSSAGRLRTDSWGFSSLIGGQPAAVAQPIPSDPELTLISGLVYGHAVKLVPVDRHVV